MSEQDIKNKNLVLIDYLRSIIDGYKIKAEYSTNDKDIQVIITTGRPRYHALKVRNNSR